MNCAKTEKYLINLSELTPIQEQELLLHAKDCIFCAEALELLQLQQTFVDNAKIVTPELVHSAVLTKKIMQALPEQRIKSELWILNPLRIAYGLSSFLLLFFLGWELLRDPAFERTLAPKGPQLHSSNYITHPLQREIKPLDLIARIKTKTHDSN
jgi:hypothetical protein